MHFIVQLLLVCLIAMFLCYVAVEVRSTRKGSSQKRPMGEKCNLPQADKSEYFPTVSVLLPVYNEKLVVEKLIAAVCAMRYPKDKLEILVLDDSTDETGIVVENAIKKYAATGINIRQLRRSKRIGFKAGNLRFGIRLAKGDFIAIFDADCLPPPDFLLRVMPYFTDERVGFLQTGIAYSNAESGFLTRFQATEAAHKEDVTTGFAADGFMASLTGSSCVWRRACIEDIGGISTETITEDVDMGYSAQLRAWNYVYPREVISWAELPETMAAFRVQRERWARGLAHNACRHAKKLFSTPMTFMSRAHAIALVFSPLLLAAFYALLLLAPLIALATPHLGLFFNLACLVFLLAAILWGWTNAGGGSGGKQSATGQVLHVGAYILFFFPLSLYYFCALMEVAFNIRGSFNSTPKGCGRKKIQHPPVNKILLVLEVISFLYALGTIILAVTEKNYWVVLYGALAFGGFGMSLFFSFSDSRKKNAAPGHVLITGASGSLGSALAREYSGPGIQLTLQGRDTEKLSQIAAECEKKGANVSIKKLDLTDCEKVRQWAQEIGNSSPPDLVIANAGLNTNIGPALAGEPFDESLALVQVNLIGVMALVDGLLPALRKKGSGQIAIVSSLAAYYGLMATPTYCATKAALKSWGTSLRGWLAKEGICVNVILPGYVKSPMCDAMPGPKPFLMQPSKAARIIRRGLEKDRARISFPFPLNLGIWGLSVLPACLAMPIAKVLGYGR